MLILILGIVIFLGAHSFTTLRERRAGVIARIGEQPYKGLYSLVSLSGFVLIVWGFARYRAADWVQLWVPPHGIRHVTIVLMWFAFVALAAGGKQPSRIRGWLRHPMLVAVKIWALAHLLANGDLGGLVLFGSFLAWAVYDRISVKRRGDVGAPRVSEFTRADAIAVGAGTVAYVAMIFLHPWLIGVSVLPV
jgi:uncharacterized membrane protein